MRLQLFLVQYPEMIKKADIIREQLSDLINIGIMEGSSINNAKKEYSEMEDVDLKHASMHMFFYNNTKK